MSTLVRLSAIALLAGGLLQVPATALDPDLYDPRALFNPAEIPAHAIFWIAYLLITLGLPAAYFIHMGKMGWLGTVGFLLALAGSAMTMSVSLLDGFALPLIAASHPAEATPLALVGPGGTASALMPALLATAVTFFPGYVMFGIALARAAVIQAWAGWLLVMGTILTIAAFAAPAGRLPTIIGSLLLAAAFVALSRALWSRRQPSSSARP
jgi:hypothetical protein